MEQTYFKYNLKSNSKIDDYFVGKSNIYAFNTLIKNKLNNNNFLLVGPSKSGKTHLSSIWQKKYNADFLQRYFPQCYQQQKHFHLKKFLKKTQLKI